MVYNADNYDALRVQYLKVGDYINLPVNGEVHKLKVEETFFSNQDAHKEAEFVEFMNVDRNEFADKIYGYTNFRYSAVEGFPDYSRLDMVSATRYALALFEYFLGPQEPVKVLKLDTIKVL